ncbi:MAG TPA: GFA family protein [Allosphingosinicella sp.]
MDEWKLPWEGGCRCGKVRIRVTKPPLLTGACHCTGCQRMSASAFSLTVTVPADGFEVTKGEPVLGGLKGPVSHHHHCPGCMSWMFTRAEGFDWFVNVRPSMLDDHHWFAPFVDIFTGEGLLWAATGAPHRFEGSPGMEDFQRLMQAFAAEGARP